MLATQSVHLMPIWPILCIRNKPQYQHLRDVLDLKFYQEIMQGNLALDTDDLANLQNKNSNIRVTKIPGLDEIPQVDKKAKRINKRDILMQKFKNFTRFMTSS
jgi:protein-tyrosine phosphatase